MSLMVGPAEWIQTWLAEGGADTKDAGGG